MAAGGRYQGIKIAFGISSASVYASFWRVLDAIDGLDWMKFRFSSSEEEIVQISQGFEDHSTHGVMNRCVGAADGVRVLFPTLKQCPYRRRLYSGHKTGYGLNAQAIFDSNYKFFAFSIMAYGSMHDSRAWEYSKFMKL
ncbi:hypothetical protein SARC_10885, partial [Sphaeroforma arctica JP610]